MSPSRPEAPPPESPAWRGGERLGGRWGSQPPSSSRPAASCLPAALRAGAQAARWRGPGWSAALTLGEKSPPTESISFGFEAPQTAWYAALSSGSVPWGCRGGGRAGSCPPGGATVGRDGDGQWHVPGMDGDISLGCTVAQAGGFQPESSPCIPARLPAVLSGTASQSDAGAFTRGHNPR